MTQGIPQEVYKQRREAVLDAIGTGVALVPAGESSNSLTGLWDPDWNFYYLTGIENEPGAMLLLEGGQQRDTLLFLRPLDPEVEAWDGLRHTIGARLRQQMGVEKIHRLSALPGMLNQAARRTRRLVCLLPFAAYNRPLSADLAIFKQVADHVPGVKIEDMTDLLPALRCRKDAHELALMRQAVSITIESMLEAVPKIKPGLREYELQEMLEHGYKTRHARRTAFCTIVGSGVNSTVLHYRANDEPMQDGDVVVVDTGASYMKYSADITRTFPVSGRFSEEQARIYDLVLDVQKKMIERVGPGITLSSAGDRPGVRGDDGGDTLGTWDYSSATGSDTTWAWKCATWAAASARWSQAA
ncbi:aminopeptidase P family protein [bacterium]|nr:aminopeptidase P family protein [bacterium]